MKKIYLLLVICILLTSCFDLFDPAYWKDGDYILSSNPGEPSCLSLTNDGIVLLDCVKSIGSNKEYIIAQETNAKKAVKLLDNQKTWKQIQRKTRRTFWI